MSNIQVITIAKINHLFCEPSKSAIYGILNLVNGKIYIGSAVEVLNRLRTHKSRLNLNKHPSKHLQGAYNQYSSFAFEFIILEYCSKDDLVEREQAWFDLTNCCNPTCGYNKRKTATSNIGLKLGPASEERKRKLSLIHTGRVISVEQREKISKTLTGRKHSLETRAKVSAAGRRPSSANKKLKLSLAHKAKSSWLHEKGYGCNCRECLDRKNLEKRLKRYNREGEFS